MRPFLVAATALAIVCACGAYTPGVTTAPDGGPPIGIITTDAGDAGPRDGGGDAGPTSDAGCTALTLAGVPATDGCISNPPTMTTATGTVNTVNCTIDISLATATTPCRGAVSGTRDAFDGGCQGTVYTCTSPSLPGTMTCLYGTNPPCYIKICDAGAACP
jgi:hypothetical protein